MGQGGTADLGAGLDGFLNDLARRIARYLGEQMRGESPRDGWIDQQDSPLGRNHNAAVRRRLASGESGADIIGRRHFLTREALAEEIKRASLRRSKRARSSEETDPVDELDRALSKLGGRDH